MKTDNPYRKHFPLMLLAGIALLAGLWGGLARLGWPVFSLQLQLPPQHGPLMVSGFLGTLISLERAVTLNQYQEKRLIYYAAPLLAGLGAIAIMTNLPPEIGRTLGVLGAFGMVIMFVIIYRLQPTTDHAVMGTAALLWLIGNLLWLFGQPLFHVVIWWSGFLVLTIAGERLELGRVLLLGKTAQRTFLVVFILFLAGLAISLGAFTVGVRISGLALIALGVWLLRFDLARYTIRKSGLTRFIAACLLPGYFWLIVGGIFWLIYGGQYPAGPLYDAMLHTIFLGFVFSMIFGHAPIIVPAIIGLQMTYTPIFYIHLSLLHISLVLRVIGDVMLWQSWRKWGGLLNEVAVVLFLFVTAVAVIRTKRQQQI